MLPNSGPAILTNRRLVLNGEPQREWNLAKLVGIADVAGGHTLLQVSNRKRSSGLMLDPSVEPIFRFQLALALADFAGDRSGLVRHLELLTAEHQRVRPAPPPVATPEQAPAIARFGPRALIAGAAVLVILLCTGMFGLAAMAPPEPAVTEAAPSTVAPATPAPPSPSPSPSPTPTSPSPSPKRTHSKAPAPNRTTAKPAPKPVNLCGAPKNPCGYNFCGGSRIYDPKPDTCSYFACIDYFWNGKGYMVQCNDGMYSLSGRRRGVCSYHHGYKRTVFS